MLRVLAATLLTFFLACGGEKDPPALDPLGDQVAIVNRTLRLRLLSDAPPARAVTWSFDAPDLPNARRTGRVLPTAVGAEFRWTPLASDVGIHEITFRASNRGGAAIQTVRVEVLPATDAVPIFLLPGEGRLFDLRRDPCIEVPIAVQDADSTDVVLTERPPLIAGGVLTRSDEGKASWRWCPSPAQVELRRRYTLHLSASDGEHAPTLHDFVIVLVTAAKPDCPGVAPSISVSHPADGATVVTGGDYPILVDVADDGPLRESPILYYTTEEPDLTAPDLGRFEMAEFEPLRGSRWRAWLPTLGIAPSSQRTVWFAISATDNDDARGTPCDHTAISTVHWFVAADPGGAGGRTCDPCSHDGACESGICVAKGGSSFCAEPCGRGGACAIDGSRCQTVTTRDGWIQAACAPEGLICDSRADEDDTEGEEGSDGSNDEVNEPSGPGEPVECVDDDLEPNDSPAEAERLPSGAISGLRVCSGNDDFFAFDLDPRRRLEIGIDFPAQSGNLDLRLLDASGRELGLSERSNGSSETLSACLEEGGRIVANVYGYHGAQNAYSLRAAPSDSPCCINDLQEPNDGPEHARAIASSQHADGVICNGDQDYYRLSLRSNDEVRLHLDFVHAHGDLDLELYAPDGVLFAVSKGKVDDEDITVLAGAAGSYVVRVFNAGGAENGYRLDVAVASGAGCRSDAGCAIGALCRFGRCEPDDCTMQDDCRNEDFCPDPGPGGLPGDCTAPCTDSGCRNGYACKVFRDDRWNTMVEGCGLAGLSLAGDSCATYRDCNGAAVCLDEPGGTCAVLGCDQSKDCPNGGHCVPGQPGEPGVCRQGCALIPARCRLDEGYVCGWTTDAERSWQQVCLAPEDATPPGNGATEPPEDTEDAADAGSGEAPEDHG